MNRPRISRWRSEAARERFVTMEDEIWAERWPEPPPAQDVDTYAGPTRVYRWPGAGEPIVFLHGMGGTGLMWSPYVERLAGRDLCAIDTIGDVGRSVQRIPIEDADGLARWLAESLTGAGIERAHLVGTSYGGFLALGLAVREPERVSSLTLIDSGGLAPFRLGRFMLWGLPNRTWSAPWRRAPSAAGSRAGARCWRTRASCAWPCTPSGTTRSGSRARWCSPMPSSGRSRPTRS
jgi:pimeloyl-ACP methyl ester carboxylesterase